MTLNELANLAVHATFSDHQDPVAAIEALEIRWRSARDPAGKATPLADALLRALRRTDPAALKRPPYLLLQAAAVVLAAAATPNTDAAELAAADPVTALQRWLTDRKAADHLRRLPTPQALQRTQALGLLAGLGALGLGTLAGYALARRDPAHTS